MSRDFTPQMHYMISRENPHMYQSQITYTLVGQEPAPMFTEEQLELMKKYDTLYPITIDFFFELWERMSERDFERLNDTFKELVAAPQKDWNRFPEELVKYFKGELDPSFYYHEDNDRLCLYVKESGKYWWTSPISSSIRGSEGGWSRNEEDKKRLKMILSHNIDCNYNLLGVLKEFNQMFIEIYQLELEVQRKYEQASKRKKLIVHVNSQSIND